MEGSTAQISDQNPMEKAKEMIRTIDREIESIFLDVERHPLETIKVRGERLDDLLASIKRLEGFAAKNGLLESSSPVSETINDRMWRVDMEPGSVSLFWDNKKFNYRITGYYDAWTLTLVTMPERKTVMGVRRDKQAQL